MQSTWSHQAWVATGCTTVLISLARSMTSPTRSQMWLEPILAGLAGYVLADLTTGLYHWAIDNYGSASTPLFGSQIEGFQGHHKLPLAITKHHFSYNLYALGQAVTFLVLPMAYIFDHPVLLVFIGVWAGFVLFCQQFHRWAHCSKDKLPRLVVALQDAGLLVSRFQHRAHHKRPYNNNYCIVSGIWNGILDKCKVFVTLEMVLFFMFGVQPRSWSSEPNPEGFGGITSPS